jgi:hypothetical protein
MSYPPEPNRVDISLGKAHFIGAVVADYLLLLLIAPLSEL